MFKEGDLVITTDKVAFSLQGKSGVITKVYTKRHHDELQQIYRMAIFDLPFNVGTDHQEGCFDWCDEGYIRKLTKLEQALS